MSFLLRGRRRKLFVVAGTIGGMIVAGAAVAYFTGANGTGTGQAAVGSSAAWAVSVNSGGATGGPIYPGNGTEKIPFTVTNNGGGNQNLRTVTYAIKSDGSGNVTSNGTTVTGCLATWFNAAADGSNPALPDDLGASGTYQGNVDVTMTNASVAQDACQGKQPDVTVTATS